MAERWCISTFVRVWCATEDGAEPFADQVQFMSSLLYDSFLAS